MIALRIIVFLDALTLGLVVPIIPLILIELQVSPIFITGIVGAYALSAFVAAPIVGLMSDKFGRKKIIAFTLLISSLSYLFLSETKLLVLIFIFRCVGGFAAARDGVYHAQLLDLVRIDDRLQALGRLSAFRGLGLALGPVIGGLIAYAEGRGGEISSPFLVASSVTVMLFLFSLYFVRDCKSRPSRGELTEVSRLRSSRGLISLFILTCSSAYPFGVLVSTAVLFTSRSFGWQQLENGFLLGGLALIVLIIRAFFASGLVASLGPNLLIIVGQVIGFFGSIFMFMSSSIGLFLFGFTLVSLCYALVVLLTLWLISQRSGPEASGFEVGIHEAALTLSLVVSSILSGILFEEFGSRTPFGVASIFSIVGIVVWLFGVRPEIATKRDR